MPRTMTSSEILKLLIASWFNAAGFFSSCRFLNEMHRYKIWKNNLDLNMLLNHATFHRALEDNRIEMISTTVTWSLKLMSVGLTKYIAKKLRTRIWTLNMLQTHATFHRPLKDSRIKMIFLISPAFMKVASSLKVDVSELNEMHCYKEKEFRPLTCCKLTKPFIKLKRYRIKMCFRRCFYESHIKF